MSDRDESPLNKQYEGTLDLDVQGGGQSIGVPAAGQHEGHSYSPSRGPGIHH